MPTDLTRLQSNQPVLITDGTNSASITAGSLLKIDGGSSSNIPVALQAGSNLVGSVKIVDAAGSNQLAVDASGRLTILSIVNALPTGSNTIGTVNLGTGQPDVTQAVSIVANSTGSTALSMSGMQGAGFWLNAIGTGGVVKPQVSMDGGTTWTDTVFITPSTGASVATAGAATTNWIIANTCGASHVRVFTTALTSGTLTGTLRATETATGGSIDATTITSALPAGANLIGGVEIYDGAGTNKLTVLSTGEANTNLTRVGGSAIAIGQAAMAASLPVVIASNQSTLPTNVAQVNGATTVTAASGVQKVGIVGNAGAVVDFVGQNAAQPANSILVGAEFNTTPTTLTTGNASPLQLDSAGNLLVNIKANSFGTLTVSGTVTANQGTAAALASGWPVKVTDGTNTMPTGDVAARGIFEKITDGTNTAGVTASSALKVDLSATGANATAIKVDGSAVTQPVAFGETTTGIVNNYVATASTASGASANADYTVTAGKTFYLKGVQVAASSGPCKFDVVYDPASTNVSIATVFITAASPAYFINLPQPFAAAATKVVRVICTNSAGSSQSMYVTAMGHEI